VARSAESLEILRWVSPAFARRAVVGAVCEAPRREKAPVDAARVVGYARFFPARDKIRGAVLFVEALALPGFPAKAGLDGTGDILFRCEAFAQRGPNGGSSLGSYRRSQYSN
jgi:hypothetical protein